MKQDEGIVREGKEEITEGYELIAKFMGGDDYVRWCTDLNYQKQGKYHTSWDWLMPVVEKIETIQVEGKYFNYYGFGVTVVQDYCSIKCYERNKQDGHIYMTPYGFKPASKINAVWLAVIEFIKWYNQNKPAK